MTTRPIAPGPIAPNPMTPGPGQAKARGPAGRFRDWASHHVAWIIIGAIVAVLGIVTLAQSSANTDKAPLSASNPAPDGAMAAAEILRRHGVTVVESDSFAATTSLLAGKPRATVFLYDRNGYLDSAQLHSLLQSAGRVVVVAPGHRTLAGLSSEIHNAGVVPDSTPTLEAGCVQADALAAGRVSGKGALLYTGAEETCYRPSSSDGGIYAASADGRLVVLGSTALLSNDLLQAEGNAALALRTLGPTPDLVWYLPGLGDVPSDGKPPTLNDLAPPWVGFLGLWLAVVALLAVVWQGRRLGPLVFEPLPVVVKAVETAEGRARLYQDSRAFSQAADNLRAGTLTRLAKHFRLGPDAGANAVLDAVSRKINRPAQELRMLLLDHRPRTESELVQWAQSIEKLEQEATAP
ncbi:DUF4350 domain-containing protein [Arthrobacter bambusae]|uniref:DUF4350 domain-containing protein n=1 Tax=Arthrobacter bambusae TaxID=1338426 RepID=UPI0027820AB9|nr:DUF4350 domain-containing protein [Arthrobacter bambusae]MDQ0030222.1 hypothetical protein [Arthrobacter bambusae]MDQ0097904.1 hypothetical protein [Arthrobacter bambusae]